MLHTFLKVLSPSPTLSSKTDLGLSPNYQLLHLRSTLLRLAPATDPYQIRKDSEWLSHELQYNKSSRLGDIGAKAYESTQYKKMVIEH
jgi:hypothetical protein